MWMNSLIHAAFYRVLLLILLTKLLLVFTFVDFIRFRNYDWFVVVGIGMVYFRCVQHENLTFITRQAMCIRSELKWNRENDVHQMESMKNHYIFTS